MFEHTRVANGRRTTLVERGKQKKRFHRRGVIFYLRGGSARSVALRARDISGTPPPIWMCLSNPPPPASFK